MNVQFGLINNSETETARSNPHIKKAATTLAGLGGLTEPEIVQDYFLPAFFAAQ